MYIYIYIPVSTQKSYQLQLRTKLNALLNECAGNQTFPRMGKEHQ